MSSLSNISKNNLLPFLYIVLFLLVGRLIPHPPNFTPILAVAILAPYIFNNRFLSLFNDNYCDVYFRSNHWIT